MSWTMRIVGWSWSLLLLGQIASAQPVIQTGYTAIAGSTVIIPISFGQARCAAGARVDVLCAKNTQCPDSTCVVRPFTPPTMKYRIDIGGTSLVTSTAVSPTASTVSIVIPSSAVTIPNGRSSPATAMLTVQWSDPSGALNLQDVVFSIRRPQFVP